MSKVFFCSLLVGCFGRSVSCDSLTDDEHSLPLTRGAMALHHGINGCARAETLWTTVLACEVLEETLGLNREPLWSALV